ncbi:RNA polymerase sigma factor [Syntrophobotulus glycolicus]|uniref:RNA polymerase sigma factor n=1 Tax=Syntrophobotulus glycolicus TaxID=51197 RepID=UPI001FA6C273|nr:sigma-70 family RNA polymerase sigma factor [Syntrophobotulus glycolicus]
MFHGPFRNVPKSPPTHANIDEQEVAATTTATTNEALYAAYLGGDGNALRILMERHGNALTLYINGYIHDIHESEDLMIEAFSRMVAAKPRLVENGFKAYLYKTARNLALRHANKRRHSCFSLEDLENEPESRLLVEAVLQTEEQNRILRQCMEQINPDYREALYLLYFENMSYAQAAQVMGKTTKQIDHLLGRGKKALRPLLEQEGITDAQYR